jgi:PAS domain S-box-containing protein
VFTSEVAFPCGATTMPKFWRLAAECLVASLALTSVTVVCYRLHFNLAANALLLMMFVVLTARLGSFFSSIFASIVAAVCLTYMVPPAFSFRVTDPLDGVAIIAFLSTSFIIARLMATVRNQAEEALSSAAIVDSSEDAIVSKTLEGIITNWNASAERLFGYTASEAIGQHISLIIPFDRRDEETVIIERIKRGERIEHCDTVRVGKDKKPIEISLTISPVRDASGKIIGASKIARDIIQRKRIERELRESEDRYRTLADALETQVQLRTQELERRNAELRDLTTLLQTREELLKTFVKHVPAAVAMLDRDMRYLQVSNRWCADFSLDSSQLLGRSHYEIFPDLPERWRQIHRRCLKGETLRAEEDPWDRAGGTTWLRWEIRPWQNLDGVPGGILIFSEDITHRKHAEEALVSLSGRLIEAQDEERKRIAREIHDDYNQRLAMMAIDLKQLAEDLADSSGEASQKVDELFNRVSVLGADLHSLSHRLHSSTLESLGLVAGLKAFCREFSEQQGIQVDFANENVPRGVPADAALCMFRIAQEALRNTKRHSGANRAEVRLEQLEGRLHLSVSDCGRGFNSNKPPAERGIGIHSMEERLRLLGGELQIQSRPMEGTRIDAWLPLKMASAA